MSSNNTKKAQSKEVVPTTQRRSSRNHHRSVLEVVTTTTTSKATAVPSNNDSDNEDDDDDDFDDDDDDETPLTKLVVKQKRKEVLKSNQRRLTIESSDDDDEEDSHMLREDEHLPTTRNATADAPLVTLSTTASLTTSPDTPHSKNIRRRNTPSRASAIKASRTFQLDDSDSNDDSSSLEVVANTKKTTATRQLRQTKNATPPKASSRKTRTTPATSSRKKRTVFDSDDEEYQDDDEDDPSDDDESDNSALEQTSDVTFVGDVDDDEISEVANIKNQKSRHDGVKVGIVHEQDIGEKEIDDDDDDDDDDSSIIVIPKPFGSPRLEVIEPRLHRSALQHDDDSDDSGNYSSSTIDKDNNIKSTQKSQSVRKMPKCIRCDSTKDAVTADDLPAIHICFFPPDNQNKQCFALETLRKIALAQPNSRRLVVNNSNGTIERTPTHFLQPPHFRTPMSDDLLDQIASRFGRAATDIHGEYYRRNDELPQNETTNNTTATHRTPGSSVRLAQSESIIDQLDRYMRQRLGNQDIYCCPICYVVAHQRLGNTDEANGTDDDIDDDSDIRDQYVTEFSYDPMTVLGYIGTCGDPFRIASTFCYKKLSLLKEHLRRDHNVDTKIVDGNDIYTRFKVRAQDGLLQRYLNKNSGKFAPTRQGEMLQYWIYGNNSDFVLLLSLISHANLCREILKQSDTSSEDDPAAVENAEQFLLPSFTFFESFSNNAQSIWKVVTAPFLKVTKEEIRDFIADDEYDYDDFENDTDGPTLSHQALHMQAELEELERERHADEELAARYERQVRSLRRTSDDDDDDSPDPSEDGDESDVASDESNAHVPGSESDNDDDEWQKSILERRVAKLKSSTPQKRGGRRVSMSSMKVSPKKRLIAIQTNDSDNESPLVTASSSVGRKRLAIQDSDDD